MTKINYYYKENDAEDKNISFITTTASTNFFSINPKELKGLKKIIKLNLRYLKEDNVTTKKLNELKVFIDFDKPLHCPLITTTAALINYNKREEIEDLIYTWLYEDFHEISNVDKDGVVQFHKIKKIKDFVNYLMDTYVS